MSYADVYKSLCLDLCMFDESACMHTCRYQKHVGTAASKSLCAWVSVNGCLYECLLEHFVETASVSFVIRNQFMTELYNLPLN